MKEFGIKFSGAEMIQIIKNFISLDLCEDILEYLEKTNEWKDNPPFPNTEIIYIDDSIGFNKLYSYNILNLKNKMQKEIETFNDLKLKPLSFYFIKWKPHSYLDFHSDNSNLDGTDNGFSHLKHAAMIYLNDNFNGGELVFQKNNISLKPVSGTFLAFDGGINNIHSVNDILDGTRYVIGTFWDYDV